MWNVCVHRRIYMRCNKRLDNLWGLIFLSTLVNKKKYLFFWSNISFWLEKKIILILMFFPSPNFHYINLLLSFFLFFSSIYLDGITRHITTLFFVVGVWRKLSSGCFFFSQVNKSQTIPNFVFQGSTENNSKFRFHSFYRISSRQFFSLY